MNPATILAILCITAVLIIAIANQVDGMLIAGGCTILGGLGGYGIHVWQSKRKGGK